MHRFASITKWHILGIAGVLALSMVAVTVILGALGSNRASAHGGDAAVIHACVNTANAQVRIAHPGPGNASTDCTGLGVDWINLDLDNQGANWSLAGNGGTTSTDFIGTTDGQALELHVNGQRALKMTPNSTSPNLIGGSDINSVTTGAVAATIGGGGAPDDGFGSPVPNRVTDDQGTVSGGWGNQAGSDDASTFNATGATVGGGESNTASAFGATVAGGTGNSASGSQATVGGGNINTASVGQTTVGGGSGNSATGTGATIGGGLSNDAGGNSAVVAGGSFHDASGLNSAIVGGFQNIASGDRSFVGGGRFNDAGGTDAAIGGGDANAAIGETATVAGGSGNVSNALATTVGGGSGNLATGNLATVGGGIANVASGVDSTVSGGLVNISSGFAATIPGGDRNEAAGDYSFAAGRLAKIDALHEGTFLFADSQGFNLNSAAANEFAVRSTGGARFISAIDGSGNPTAGVEMAPGAGSWSSLSDRNAKANFAIVHGQDILERLKQIPMETWNYQSQDSSIRHIGPMAQDFYAAFGVGEDNRHISTVDADGVALAAIQGLYELVQEQDTQRQHMVELLATQQQEIAALQAIVATLIGIYPEGVE